MKHSLNVNVFFDNVKLLIIIIIITSSYEELYFRDQPVYRFIHYNKTYIESYKKDIKMYIMEYFIIIIK